MRAIAVLALSIGCGRINFGTSGGGTLGDGGNGGNGDSPDGATDRANVAFVTTNEVPGIFATLADADMVCQMEADAVGLQGTFIAWLSNATTLAPDRLAGSRGWRLVDGRPVFNTPADLLAKRMFNPINLTAGGVLATGNVFAWTGTDRFLGHDANCGNWTGGPGGSTGRFTEAFYMMTELGQANCTTEVRHLYCLEVGHDVAVAPAASVGRVAFLSTPQPVTTLAAFDSACQTEAMNAGINGTFVAGVATTTTTVASRVTPGADWFRVDGTKAITSSAMSNGGDFESFVTQQADGTYVNDYHFSGAASSITTGSAMETCASWTSPASNNGLAGYVQSTTASRFWSGIIVGCGGATHVLCLQQ